MPTALETILAELHARLSALPATALRGEVLPERVPGEGLLILRDSEPGETEFSVRTSVTRQMRHEGRL